MSLKYTFVLANITHIYHHLKDQYLFISYGYVSLIFYFEKSKAGIMVQYFKLPLLTNDKKKEIS